MQRLLKFLNIIAWIFGVFSFIAAAVCIYLNSIYQGSIDELIDRSKGQIRTYPVGKWLFIFILCLAFIIANW